MSNLNEAQIDLINKIGYTSIAETELTLTEAETLETLKKSRLTRVRVTSKYFNPDQTVFYELSKRGLALHEDMKAAEAASAIIEEPATDEIELAAPTDATLGDELFLGESPEFKAGDKAIWRGKIAVVIVNDYAYLPHKRSVKLDAQFEEGERNREWDVRVKDLSPAQSASMLHARHAADTDLIARLEARVKELEAQEYELPTLVTEALEKVANVEMAMAQKPRGLVPDYDERRITYEDEELIKALKALKLECTIAYLGGDK